MPFKSEAQRRYLWANEPEIARDWTDTYGSRIEKSNGGITSTKTVKGQPHLLAYITPNEVNKLKVLGGQETMTPEGIPAYPEFDNYSGDNTPGGAMSRSDFEGGAYGGTGSAGDGVIDQYTSTPQDIDSTYTETSFDKKPKEKFWNKFNTWNSNFQQQKNKALAQKRALQKYKDLEEYVTKMDDYYDPTASGYDFSKLDKGKQYLGSNVGTSLEEYRKNLSDVNPRTSYSMLQSLLAKTRPDTQVTAKNTLEKARAYNKLAMDPNITSEKLAALANLGKINTPTEGDEGGRFSSYEEWLASQQKQKGAGEEEVIEEATDWKTTPWDFNQKIIYDDYAVKKDGGRIPAAFGGIMDTSTGRKRYVFGSVKKAVKGVAKAAGKVLKSDLGKAALIGGGLWAANAGHLGGFGKNWWTNMPGGNWGRGLFALSTLPFLGIGTKAKQDKLPDQVSRGGKLIDPITNQESTPKEMRTTLNTAIEEAGDDPIKIAAIQNAYPFVNLGEYLPYPTYGVKDGGRIPAQEGGLMNLGGMEKDYRNNGGFVAIGGEERADDVPARLSRNEFVFTADAVRGAGGGDIDKGAEIMENVMKNLEQGGKISEETQGNAGAQEMFSVSERIGEVI